MVKIYLGKQHRGFTQQKAIQGQPGVLRHHVSAAAQKRQRITLHHRKLRKSPFQICKCGQIIGAVCFLGVQRGAKGQMRFLFQSCLDHLDRAECLKRPVLSDQPLQGHENIALLCDFCRPQNPVTQAAVKAFCHVRVYIGGNKICLGYIKRPSRGSGLNLPKRVMIRAPQGQTIGRGRFRHVKKRMAPALGGLCHLVAILTVKDQPAPAGCDGCCDAADDIYPARHGIALHLVWQIDMDHVDLGHGVMISDGPRTFNASGGDIFADMKRQRRFACMGCALPPYRGRVTEAEMADEKFPGWHGTTILAVRRGGEVVVAGDGQVSLGQTVIKGTARKVRRLSPAGHDVVAGFAGSTADAFTLLERLEKKLESMPGQLARASVELAKDWRMDKYLRNLEAMLIVTDGADLFVITGAGDVLEPEHDVAAIGSGGNFALAAARGLMTTDLPAIDIARRAMAIAADICVYTNGNLTVETIRK